MQQEHADSHSHILENHVCELEQQLTQQQEIHSMPHLTGGGMAPMQPTMPAMAGNTQESTQAQGASTYHFGQQQNNHHPPGWNS